MYSRLPGMTNSIGVILSLVGLISTRRYPLYVTLVGGTVKRSKSLSLTAANWAWALVASFPPNTTLIFYEMMKKRALKSFLNVSGVSNVKSCRKVAVSGIFTAKYFPIPHLRCFLSIPCFSSHKSILYFFIQPTSLCPVFRPSFLAKRTLATPPLWFLQRRRRR